MTSTNDYYFIIRESRHHGWLAYKSNLEECLNLSQDPDNMTVYPCQASNPVKAGVKYVDIEACLDNLVAWQINLVDLSTDPDHTLIQEGKTDL